MRSVKTRKIVFSVCALLYIFTTAKYGNALYFNIANLIGIYGIASIGLVLLTGYAGQISLGHAGFFGIGAYGAAILPQYINGSPLLSVLLAMIIAIILSILVGRTILGLQGHFLAMATLAFGSLVHIVFSRNISIFGGPDGVLVPELLFLNFGPKEQVHWYLLIVLTFAIGYWFAANLINSRYGRAWLSIRESEVTSQVSGVNVGQLKLLAFMLSAVYGSIAGSIYAFYAGFITPEEASLMHSFEFLIIVLVGGARSLIGTVVGAALIVVLPHLLNEAVDYEMLLTGLILLFIVMFLPRGVIPTVRRKILRIE